jgi:COMPASS component SWD3
MTTTTTSSFKKRPYKDDTDSAIDVFQQFPYHGEHKRAVSAVALAPSKLCDSPLCASASADGTVKLWQVYQDEAPSDDIMPCLTSLVGHSRGINDVTWSPQAPYVATASDDKSLRLWDAHTGEALVEFRGHSNFVFCCKFNPQSNLLVSGSFDETVKLWDVRSGDCVCTLPAHSDPVTGVDLNRDGTCIVSGSHDGLIRIWDTATGECLKTIYAQANPPVSMVKYSPNGKYILSGTLDGSLRLWKTSTCCKTYVSHSNSKYCLASDFLVGGQAIVTGSESGQIYLYDLQSQKVQQILEGHKDVVLAVSCHDKEKLICSGGMTADRTVQFWAPSVPQFTTNKKRGKKAPVKVEEEEEL